MTPTPVLCSHPFTNLPGRVVSQMLGVAAFEEGHPIARFVLTESNDFPFDLSWHRFIPGEGSASPARDLF
jgi:hypothetical protein